MGVGCLSKSDGSIWPGGFWTLRNVSFRDGRWRRVRVVAATGCRPFAGLLRPVCLADWCDVPSTCMSGRSILKPWSGPGLFSPGRSGGDRCVGLLTQAVASHHTWWCWRGIPNRAIRSPRLRFASPDCGSCRWRPRVGGKVVHGREGRSMPCSSNMTFRQKPRGWASSRMRSRPPLIVRHLRWMIVQVAWVAVAI